MKFILQFHISADTMSRLLTHVAPNNFGLKTESLNLSLPLRKFHILTKYQDIIFVVAQLTISPHTMLLKFSAENWIIRARCWHCQWQKPREVHLYKRMNDMGNATQMRSSKILFRNKSFYDPYILHKIIVAS